VNNITLHWSEEADAYKVKKGYQLNKDDNLTKQSNYKERNQIF
jgi:hypothetical protein